MKALVFLLFFFLSCFPGPELFRYGTDTCTVIFTKLTYEKDWPNGKLIATSKGEF
jgi:hypothetical protein